MVLGLGTRFVCILFCFFNFVVWILGCAVLAVGIFVRVEAEPWRDLVDLDLTVPSYVLIVAGTFVMFLGFLGCCGACCKGKCCLICYSVFVFLVIGLEVGGGVFAYKKRDKVMKKLVNIITNSVRDHYARSDHASISITIALDMFQERVKCCGAFGPEDFHNTYWQNATGHNETVPYSCCRKKEKGCNVNVTLDSHKIFNYGCVELGAIWAEHHILLLRDVGIGIGVTELVGFLSALCLWYMFKHEKKGKRKPNQ